ncbi:MAG: SUMF1/EgtB/PvdO family nonheme iron enzyme [Bacteroidia bacterium]
MAKTTQNDRGLYFENKDGESTHIRRRNHLLVIGINTYDPDHFSPLNNCVRDVEDFARLLTEKYQFESTDVIRLMDKEATGRNIFDQLRTYARTLNSEDNLVIYFSGHGHLEKINEAAEEGYWIPADGEKEVFRSWMENSGVLREIGWIQTHHTLLIIDSCFSGTLFFNPKSGDSKYDKAPSRYAIASGSKELVSDGTPGKNSPFATELLRILRQNDQPELKVSDISQEIKNIPFERQTPNGSPINLRGHQNGEFVFRLRKKAEPAWETLKGNLSSCEQYLIAYPQGKLLEEVYWEIACLKDKPEEYRKYLRKYRRGKYAIKAAEKLETLEEKTAFESAKQKGYSALIRFLNQYPESPYAAAAEDEIERLEALEKPVNIPVAETKTPLPPKVNFPLPEMVLIKGGTFQREKYKVTVSDFWLGKTAVTVSTFAAFITATGYKTEADKSGWRYVFPAYKKISGVNWRCDILGEIRPENEWNHPVIHVSWNDAKAYCDWLSKETGQQWRLPTEAEWEYAAGGGSEQRTIYAGTDDESELGEYAWYSVNSDSQTHPVGQKKTNRLGLYDMSGNVWEWCSGWYGDYPAKDISDPQGPEKGTNRVYRGGSWLGNAERCRVSNRNFDAPDLRNFYLGFRVARTN